MTVQIQNSVQYFAGPIEVGTTLSIVDFTFIDDSHVSVKIRNNPEVWRYGYDYDVYGAQTLERQITVWRRVEEGEVLAVYLDVPITQNIAPEEGGNFPASTNEFVLDKLTYISQMLYERVARSMQVSIDTEFDGTLPNLVPGKAIKINAAGTGLELSDLDPDQAVKEIQQYIKIAEEAADSAEFYASDAKATVDNLNATADEIYAAGEEVERVANEAVNNINNAAEHRLNSKEIGALIESPAILTNTDLHKADGSIITENDDIHAQFHNVFMKKQRELTDIKTKYYKYNSYNYSRVWYSTVKSEPDRFYGLTDVLNAPAGTWYLMDRSGEMIAKSSVECKSYYKYELINAVGDAKPNQYVLWPVQMGEAQKAEPDTSDSQDFYAFDTDERLGLNIDKITNIIVLPPDITSEFRRVQITRIDGDNTYYYYYKATPIEIHAYVNGTVDELNLAAKAGAQTDATVIKPYLLTTHQGIFEKITNAEFFTTKEWFEAKEGTEDYNKIYTSLDNDLSYDIVNLHDEVTRVGQPTNRLGVFSGFTVTDYLQINRPIPTYTTFEGSTVRVPIKKFEAEVFFKTASVPVSINNSQGILSTNRLTSSLHLLMLGATAATVPFGMEVRFYAGSTEAAKLFSKSALLPDTFYKAKILFDLVKFIKTTMGTLVDYLPEIYTDKNTLLYTLDESGETLTYTKYEFPTLYRYEDYEYIEYSIDTYFKDYLESSVELYQYDYTEEMYVKYTRPVLYLQHENGEYSLYEKTPEIFEDQKLRFYLAQVSDNAVMPIDDLDIYAYKLQSDISMSVEVFTQNLQENFTLGLLNNAATNEFNGAIDLNNSYIKINDKIWWGAKVVPYAVKDGEYITAYTSPKEQLYHKEIASNVYETNPTGYTAGGAGVAVDGWWAETNTGQGIALGTGINKQFIDLRNDSFIDIQGRFISGRLITAARGFFALNKATFAYSGPFLLYALANSTEAVIYMGSTDNSKTAWAVKDIYTGLTIEPNTEYYLHYFADFTQKYKAATVDGVTTYEEASDGTLYKYTLKLKEWKAPFDDGEVQEFVFYNTHRFGSAAGDVYRVCGVNGYTTYTAQNEPFINFYSVAVNGRMLFDDNIHIVDRPANSTALPRITDNDTQNYIVVANGLTEDFVLASPKEAIDTYVATTVAPSLQNFGEDLQETLQNSYVQYNKVMTDTYKQGMKSLQNASDAVRKSDLQRVECVVETYRNGNSWYRLWSDGWIEQGGYLSAAGTITFLKEFKYANYTVSHMPISAADPYVSNRTTTTMTITGAGCLWIARGY